MNLTMTNYACAQAARWHLTPSEIMEAFDHPESVVENETVAGQFKITGGGITFVGKYVDENKFLCIKMENA